MLLPRRPTCTGRLSPRPPPWLDTTVTFRPSTFWKRPRKSSIICCMLRSRSLLGFRRISSEPWLTGLRPLPILSATILTSGSCEISCCSGLASSTVFCRLVPMGALTLTLNSPESYVGWNSVPTKGSSSKFSSSEIMPTATTFFGLSKAQTIKLSYISRTD